MGFWSTLAKIGGVAAAPFTGGASLIPTALSVAGDVGSVLGKQQQGKAAGQQAQAGADLSYDRNKIDLYGTQQDAQFKAGQQDLERKKFEGTNRGDTAKQALIGALLSGKMDPTSISGGKASGGLLAAMQGNPDVIAAMRNLHGQADKAQMAPPSFAGGSLLQAPTLSAPPKVDSGGWLSGLANALQIGGAVGSGLAPNKASVPDLYASPGLGATIPGTPVPGLSIPRPNPYIVDDEEGR